MSTGRHIRFPHAPCPATLGDGSRDFFHPVQVPPGYVVNGSLAPTAMHYASFAAPSAEAEAAARVALAPFVSPLADDLGPLPEVWTNDHEEPPCRD